MEKKYFKVGQKVWCAIYGEGVVKNIKYTENYPIEVELKYGKFCLYTEDGKYFENNNTNVVLSTTPLPPIINEPIEDRIELPDDVVDALRIKVSGDMFYNLAQKYKI